MSSRRFVRLADALEVACADDAALGEAIRGARRERVSAEAVERLAHKLERALEAPNPPQPSAARLAPQLWIAGVTLLTLALSYWLATGNKHEPPPPSPAPAPAAHPPPANEPSLELSDVPAPIEASEPSPSAAAPAPAKRVRPARNAHPPLEPAAPQAAGPEAELALLKQAQAALAIEPARTLERVHEHLRLYPQGIFSEEREMLAIEALQKLRRSAAAAQRARQFVQDYPHSPHARRVRALLAVSPAATEP